MTRAAVAVVVFLLAVSFRQPPRSSIRGKNTRLKRLRKTFKSSGTYWKRATADWTGILRRAHSKKYSMKS